MPEQTSLASVLNELKIHLQAGITLPFEAVIVAALETWVKGRENMDPAIRNEWDRLMLGMARPVVLCVTDGFNKINKALGIEAPVNNAQPQ